MAAEVGCVLPTLMSSERTSVRSMTLFITLLSASIIIGHLYKGNRWINESIIALFIGLGSGIILLFGGGSWRFLEFNKELFFIYLLPPIIFNAGFQVKKKHFFKNFMTISLFGAVGTIISFCVITFGSKALFEKLNMGNFHLVDYLAVGAIFSATDSVCTLQVLNQDETPLLYSLVFGEGVVNDATSIVLLKAIQKFDLSDFNSTVALKFFGNFIFLFASSTLLGVLIGLLCAYIIKQLYKRHSTNREVALMILLAYLSYMMAELLDLSGILTVFFCGIVMSHYTWYNVTEHSRVTTKHAFGTMSYISETFIFLYVGMDALDIEKWVFAGKSPGKSVLASAGFLGLVAVGRAAFIFPLSLLSNLTAESKADRIDFRQQVTIWWAGLIRGAVSMALAYNQFTKSGHAHAIMITSTITVVLFSTVVFGLVTKHFIRLVLPASSYRDVINSVPSSVTIPFLNSVQQSDSDVESQLGENSPRRLSLRMLLTTPTSTIHYYWRKFDDSFMRPKFGGRGFADFVLDSP